MLTKQQRLYAEARMAGNVKKTSALLAGCPERSASQSASKLERHPKVIQYWDRNGWEPGAEKMGPKPDLTVVFPQPTEMAHDPDRMKEKPIPPTPDTEFTDPLKFMESVMNDGTEDPRLRLEAAKSLAAFTVAKPDAKKKGKEEGPKKTSRFDAIAPPALKAVR